MSDLTTEKRRLCESMATTLDKEEERLRNHFGIARDLACTEWSEGMVPSRLGGYTALRPNRMLPDQMSLLEKNFRHQLEDIRRRRKALDEIWAAVTKSGRRGASRTSKRRPS